MNNKYKNILLKWDLYVLSFYFLFILILPLFILIQKASGYLWIDFWHRAIEPVALSAYSVTLSMALCACFMNTIFGFLVAWIMSRYDFYTKSIWDGIIDLPFALPTSVAGFTLCIIYGSKGIIGTIFNRFNYQIIFTKSGILIAMLFVSFPFFVRTIQPIILTIEAELEEAAWGLGASPWLTFYKIILPNLLPSLLTAITLAFSRSIGEYGSIVIISSNLALKDLITPVLIFQCLEQYDYMGATIIGTVILCISFALLIVINIIQQSSIYNI